MDNYNYDELFIIRDDFISFLRDKNYKDSTLYDIKNDINGLLKFLIDNSFELTKEYIGMYLSYIEERKIKSHTKKLIFVNIRRFSEFVFEHNYIVFHPTNQVALPSLNTFYTNLLNIYLDFCKDDGNKENTLNSKRTYVTRFLYELENRGIQNINQLDGQSLLQILSLFESGKSNIWPIISLFLKFLAMNGLIEKDLSIIIPKIRQELKIPTVYRTDEIKAMEDSIDTNTFKGKRDKAAILLASRLGIRTCDILNLKEENLNFENNTISFVQIKTNTEITLPMVDDVRNALLDYLNERRLIDVSIDNLFISSRGYKENPLTVKSLHFALTSYLEKADIDYTGKRHGFHSLRSSLSSSMVNDNVPYDIVRKVLGHTSDDSIKHYARLDIEELRKCSIEVPAPSGKFKIFLEDGVLL